MRRRTEKSGDIFVFIASCLSRVATGSAISFSMATALVFCFGVFAFLILRNVVAHENKPEQIHIAFTGVSGERIVNYVTPSPYLKPATIAMYGKKSDELKQKATGESFVFGTEGHNFTVHNVKVRGYLSEVLIGVKEISLWNRNARGS